MRASLVLTLLMPIVAVCPASAAVPISNTTRTADGVNALSPLPFVDATHQPADQPIRDARRPIRLHTTTEHAVTLSWDRTALRERWLARTPFVIEQLPLVGGRTVDLELRPFAVTGPNTKFVVGRKGEPDAVLDFDPASVLLFRGKVMGRPGSHVFLALSDSRSTGYVDLGRGEGRFRVSSRGADGEPLPPGSISMYEPFGPATAPPGVPLCGVTDTGGTRHSEGGVAGETDFSIKHLELAVETDFEFYVLFRDLDDAAAYLVAMYGAVSDVYLRDVHTHVELVFARLWDTPDDLFNDVDPSPLPEFRQYWNANMGAVHRDLAQLLSGRRDYLFGGQAYLTSLCGGNAYSVVGYAAGFFPDPTMIVWK